MRKEGRGVIHKNHIAPHPLHCYMETTFGSRISIYTSLYIYMLSAKLLLHSVNSEKLYCFSMQWYIKDIQYPLQLSPLCSIVLEKEIEIYIYLIHSASEQCSLRHCRFLKNTQCVTYEAFAASLHLWSHC